MIIPKNLLRQNVETVRHSNTEDVYLITLLNPLRLHTTSCRTFACRSASKEKKGDSIMKLNVFPLYVYAVIHICRRLSGKSIF